MVMEYQGIFKLGLPCINEYKQKATTTPDKTYKQVQINNTSK